MEDVGEDFSISSLHIFQGDMELPPFSFHAFLEKHWDEEEQPEEIITVLKVVSPAYHRYLDVLSKLKAEKLPPHCACDHHIELEGSLPPAGVISTIDQLMSQKHYWTIFQRMQRQFSSGPAHHQQEYLSFFKRSMVGFPCVSASTSFIRLLGRTGNLYLQ
ncbi:hypothetical protein O181_013742 [Austropuccinia psidii MF-1]|uniref:Uncharacterized protein n=1 Tax=Austropuccinia psidii MF-1 TaxID=1389203 RepID=A0A9Q3GP81_9BASI|nr:hypothetical protein [Austropuccinia psidii MF-1]